MSGLMVRLETEETHADGRVIGRICRQRDGDDYWTPQAVAGLIGQEPTVNAASAPPHRVRITRAWVDEDGWVNIEITPVGD